MTRESNYQDILKLLAIIAMVIDHLGLYIFPDILVLRAIGRYAFPIFCFFAGFNFKGQINFKILAYGGVLYLLTSYIDFWQFIEANILVSIFLGHVYLYLFRAHMVDFKKAYMHFIFLGCCWLFTEKIIEYGTLVIALMVLGQISKQHPKQLPLMAFAASFIVLLHSFATYYEYFSLVEFIILLIVISGVYFSLACNNFYKTNNLKLVIISNNLMLIYCLHLILIMLVWRYYIIV